MYLSTANCITRWSRRQGPKFFPIRALLSPFVVSVHATTVVWKPVATRITSSRLLVVSLEFQFYGVHEHSKGATITLKPADMLVDGKKCFEQL